MTPARTPYPDPAQTDDLRGVLLDYLDFYRGVVATKLDGLAADDLVGSVLPSGWTPLGLVHHLVNVERRWLEWGFLGERIEEPWRDASDDGGWVTLELSVAELDTMLDDAATRTRSIVEAHRLTDVSALTGRFRDEASAPQLQWILLHVVQEYARHLGHLDIARELIDGHTGEDG
ncbi:DinB family protein [Nocardioides sp.]|uniref:DinB family protein n=1 Tax=Nocardioides sp. TaxID=35761 RepID=UPI002F405BB4